MSTNETGVRTEYAMAAADADELTKRFTYHPPKGTQPQRYEELRVSAKTMAELICELVPNSRERSLALTHLEESVMWANAAIARRE